MIIRVFTARLKPGMRATYERLCLDRGVPLMRAQPGFLTYRIAATRPERPDTFVLVSVWKDLASVRAFAGDQWQQARIVPGEADLLEEVSVRHFDDTYDSLIEMWHAMADVVKQREVMATTAPIDDNQWERIQPLLPARGSSGRPRVDDRRTLDGILYVLRTGCPWHNIPPHYGSPVTCWRRFTQWEADGTWERIWHALLATLDAAGRQTWTLAFLDSRAVPTARRRRVRADVRHA
jgi:transposase/quinol monooxygenase YgiN